MGTSKSSMSEEQLNLYNAVIASIKEVERKGKTLPYTSINGHMFSFLSKEGSMGLRLSELDRRTFLEEHNTVLMEQHGSIMKEYVKIPDALLRNTKMLSPYLKKSYDYVTALRPKPTKKK